VRGIPPRLGSFSLRDLVPFGAFRRAGAKRRLKSWRVSQRRSRARRSDDVSLNADHPSPERHVLDYRTLDSLRLVFGELYADR
jgi:hypothetical protein